MIGARTKIWLLISNCPTEAGTIVEKTSELQIYAPPDYSGANVAGRRVIAIISERDYTRKVILKGLSSKDTPVRDIMTREVLTASPSDSTEDCMRVMTEKRVRHLPVLEGTKMIGIVSVRDVMKWVISAQAEEIGRYVTGDYLA